MHKQKNQHKRRIVIVLNLLFFYMSMQAVQEQKVFIPTLENLNVLTIMPPNAKCTHSNTLALKDLIDKIQNNYNDILNVLLYVKYRDYLTEHLVIKGIPEIQDEKKFIMIHSRGLAQDAETCYDKTLNGSRPVKVPTKGGGILCAYPAIRDRYIVNMPCVTFDYPDQRRFTNLAQTLDLECLDAIVKKIPSNYKRVYFGTSRGATSLLKYELQNKSDNHPCAMILESPFMSIKNIIDGHITTVPALSYIPGSRYLIHQCALAFIKFKYPNYKQEEDNLESYLANVDSQVPILFVHLKYDPFVSDAEMFAMVDALAKKNPHIYLLVLHDPMEKVAHGRLSKAKAFQTLTNAFLKKYEIPHDTQLAERGESLLKIARKNARASSPDAWKIIKLKKDTKT